MQFTVTTNFSDVIKQLEKAESQMPFATARALTKTAQDVKEAQRKEIARVFDRPTRYTLNSVYLRPATKALLEAEVWLKGDGTNDGGSTRHYLGPTISGGGRPLKRFEQRLVRAGLMQATERAVPAGGAAIDSSGNMSRGQIVKILSQLKTAAVLGDDSNATNSKRSRAKRAKEAYFVSRGPGAWSGSGAWKNGLKSQHLPRGVWVRTSSTGVGTSVKPVLLFVKSATYRPVYKFFDLARRVVDSRFPFHFKESARIALGTALLKKQGSLL